MQSFPVQLVYKNEPLCTMGTGICNYEGTILIQIKFLLHKMFLREDLIWLEFNNNNQPEQDEVLHRPKKTGL